MRFPFILTLLLGAVAHATLASAQQPRLPDALSLWPRGSIDGTLTRRNVLFDAPLTRREAMCSNAGYSPCLGADYCCPSDGLCCNSGGCAASGGQCCTMGQGSCDPGQECCGYGCIPSGQKCCADGGFCSAGEYCVVSLGKVRCCVDGHCHAGSGSNMLSGSGNNSSGYSSGSTGDIYASATSSSDTYSKNTTTSAGISIVAQPTVTSSAQMPKTSTAASSGRMTNDGPSNTAASSTSCAIRATQMLGPHVAILAMGLLVFVTI